MTKSHIVKAKTVENKKWVNGYLIVDLDTDKYFVILGKEKWEVDKDTICDDTGITDVKNNPIFSGDILKVIVRDWKKNTEYEDLFEDFVWDDSKKEEYWSVEYKLFQTEMGFMVYGRDRRFRTMLTASKIYNAEAEVVGNIFDNPDLMKKEDKNDSSKNKYEENS